MKLHQELVKKIKDGKIGVIPTDTIYGVVTSAFSKKAIMRTYKILKRNPKKPLIVLIGSIRDLALFNIKIDNATRNILEKLWPGKVSVVLSVPSKKFQYLHRGTKTLAFRVPKKPSLIRLLKYAGPLISTSANPQGFKPATTITEAKKYFGDGVDPVRKTGVTRKNKLLKKLYKSRLSNGVDFYIDGGKIKSLPSTLVEIKNGRVNVIRKGAVKIQKN